MRIKRRSEARQPTANWKDKIWIPTELPAQFGSVPYFSILADKKKPETRVGSQLALFQEDYLAYAEENLTRWPLQKGFHIVLQVAQYADSRYRLKTVGTELSGRELPKYKHSIKDFVALTIDGQRFRAEFKFGLKKPISKLKGTMLRRGFDRIFQKDHRSITEFLDYVATENFAALKRQDQHFLSVMLIRLKHA